MALAALVLATLTLAACTGTVGSAGVDHAIPARAGRADVVVDPSVGARSERSPSDAEYPPISVDGDASDSGDASTTDEAERDEARSRNSLIVFDPYPQNPRCYTAGQYIPAPPLCPGP